MFLLPKDSVIKAAIKALRFNHHYAHLCLELEYHNAPFQGAGSVS